MRARIVLGCGAGLSNKAVAARERVSVQTVGKWRRRFVERGPDGRSTSHGRGAAQIDDAKGESVVVQTLESQPHGATHWEHAQYGAAQRHLDLERGARLARAFGLQPHRAETVKLSRDPLFVDKSLPLA